MLVFGTMTNTLFAILCLIGLTAADCVEDRDWNFGLLGQNTYYAAVPTNGDLHVFAIDQCLDMIARQCVPCSSLRYGVFFYELSKVGQCVVTSIPAGTRKRKDSMIETLIVSHEQGSNLEGIFDGPATTITQSLPAGHIIW